MYIQGHKLIKKERTLLRSGMNFDEDALHLLKLAHKFVLVFEINLAK